MDKKSTDKVAQKNQPAEAPQKAHEAAESDIAKDLDLTPPADPANDLDEGELAKFEGED